MLCRFQEKNFFGKSLELFGTQLKIIAAEHSKKNFDFQVQRADLVLTVEEPRNPEFKISRVPQYFRPFHGSLEIKNLYVMFRVLKN